MVEILLGRGPKTDAPAMRATDPAELEGELGRAIFHKPEDGFMIAAFHPRKGRETIIKGTLHQVAEGDALKLRGRWVEHPKFGRQFQVTGFEPSLPSSNAGIERYLTSGVFKGVGEKTARKIVQEFGNETFRVLDGEPEKVAAIDGVGKSHLKHLMEVWGEQKAHRDTLSFLHGLGLGEGLVNRAYKLLGPEAAKILRENPYRLVDVPGIGFQTADRVALRHMGYAPDGIERAKAGLLHVLEERAQSGHTRMPEPDLVKSALELLGVARDPVTEALLALLGDKAAQRPGPSWSLKRFADAEKRIAENLKRLASAEVEESEADEGGPDFSKLAEEAAERMGIALAPGQMDAVRTALGNKVSVITGGPGTGKTTIVRCVLEAAGKKRHEIALAAPTGRAAKRLGESTGRSASTIHRLLEFGPSGFERGREYRLGCDLVIIDETSMVDTHLMDCLLEAVPDRARVVFVGDVDQLPSVGPGSVLADIIVSGNVPVARLEAIFRQSETSMIPVNARRVRDGEMPELASGVGDALLDFYFLPEDDPNRAAAKIVEMVAKRIPKAFGMDPMRDIQVLAPMHKGALGTVNLNELLREALNPEGPTVVNFSNVFRVGDRVIQTKNDYEKGVFNGEVGFIKEAEPEKRTLVVEIDEREVVYAPKDLGQISPAYAMSVHKSQGGEYPCVVVPIAKQHHIMLQRNLLYTAITRGKRLVVIVGTDEAVRTAVANESPNRRETGLVHEVRQNFHNL